MKFKNYVKSVTDPKYLSIPNINFSLISPDDEREGKFSIQRKTVGFDDSETWSLDRTIISFILPRLKRFKEIHSGFPSNLTSKEWDKILDEMIEGFELIHESFYIINKDTKKLKIEKSLDLFHEYFLKNLI